MNRLTKTFLLAVVLSIIPAFSWAQYVDRENGFLFNVFEIKNVEERIQLASALSTSDIWICNPTENPGELFIRPNSMHSDISIYPEFDYLRMTLKEEYEEASALSKDEFAEVFHSWAQNISKDYYNFLISDYVGDRANHCMDAEPFCTTDVYEFPALNSGYSFSGPNYGCLGSSPTNKHSFWYYMRIGVAGNITILIEASFDVDFALWGPFENETDPCPTAAGETGMLTANCDGFDCPNNTTSPNFYPSGNLHDCSFDARHYEYAHVVNGQVGQYYILLITNYSGSSGTITFQKYAGDGETDCGIMPPLVNNDGPFCTGETIHLSANGQNGATYSWVGPNGFTSTQQNPTLENATINMSGTYTCTITVGAASNSANTEVIVNQMPTAGFTAAPVCKGTPMQFNATTSGNPDNSAYHWDFGDGETGEGASTTHIFAEAGDHFVQLNVENSGTSCNDDITLPVTVYEMPVPTATADPDGVIFGGTSQLNATSGIDGSFSYHWSPENMVDDPNAQSPHTVGLTATQTFTVTVTNNEGGCSATAEVEVTMDGSSLTANATADDYEICRPVNSETVTTTLHAHPHDGTFQYTYSWDHAEMLDNANSQNPIATLPVGTTTFTCTVNDGQTTKHAEVTINVYQSYDHSSSPIQIFDCDTIIWNPGNKIITDYQYPHSISNDSIITLNGTYQRTYETIHGCDSIVTLHAQFEYTPSPNPIQPKEHNTPTPHWVIPATEFQINTYHYKVEESNPDCSWTNVEWVCKGAPNWIVKKEDEGNQHPEKSSYVAITVLDRVEETVYLTAYITNDCSMDSVSYFLECSFYGVEDQDASHSNFSVVPNPNNGEMNLSFENLTGKVGIKVYDMSGNLIDTFETYNEMERNTMTYNMSQRAAGIYYFVVTSKEGTVAKKVIVTK